MKKLPSFIFLVLALTGSVKAQVETGKASFYGDEFEGKTTSNGEIYRHTNLSAAHRTLPFNTVVRVTSLANGKSVTVRINDRGPFVEGRIIDLSRSAARLLGFIDAGVTDVKVEVIGSTESSSSTKSPEVTGEFYELEVTQRQPSGFGVQIKSYRELDNIMRLVSQLKGKYNQDLMMQVVTVDSTRMYRIIIGQYATRPEAESRMKELEKEYYDCFVVEF